MFFLTMEHVHALFVTTYHIYKRGHQLSDLNKNCLGQIFVEI